MGPAESGRLRLVAGTLRERRAKHLCARRTGLRRPCFIDGRPVGTARAFHKNKGNPALHLEPTVPLAWASRRAVCPDQTTPGRSSWSALPDVRAGPGRRGPVAFGARRVAMQRRPWHPGAPGPTGGRRKVLQASPTGGRRFWLAAGRCRQARRRHGFCAWSRYARRCPASRRACASWLSGARRCRCQWLLRLGLFAWPWAQSGPTRRERSGKARRALGTVRAGRLRPVLGPFAPVLQRSRELSAVVSGWLPPARAVDRSGSKHAGSDQPLMLVVRLIGQRVGDPLKVKAAQAKHRTTVIPAQGCTQWESCTARTAAI